MVYDLITVDNIQKIIFVNIFLLFFLHKKDLFDIINKYYINYNYMNKENIYIFEWLTKEEISYFILMSKTEFYKPWQKILKEWDESNNRAYIVEKWSVDIIRGWQKISTLREWEIFWELALITNESRTADVVVNENTEVLVLLKDDFLMLYQKSGNYQAMKDRILERIKNNFYWIKN